MPAADRETSFPVSGPYHATGARLVCFGCRSAPRLSLVLSPPDTPPDLVVVVGDSDAGPRPPALHAPVCRAFQLSLPVTLPRSFSDTLSPLVSIHGKCRPASSPTIFRLRTQAVHGNRRRNHPFSRCGASHGLLPLQSRHHPLVEGDPTLRNRHRPPRSMRSRTCLAR